MHPNAKPADPVFVDVEGAVMELGAELYRSHLEKAKVTRPELFAKSKTKQPVRVHDLRALFVTLSIANGRPETWIRDRTSHRTLSMLDKYRRQARMFEELHLGELAPIDQTIPEFASGGEVAEDDLGPTESTESTSTDEPIEPDVPVHALRGDLSRA